MDLATPAERVAATVRAELARRRKTQAGLARALGLQRTSIHRRMTGEQAFRVDELHVVADYLGIPVTDLFVDGRTVPGDAA
jgi:transcriptional regulator with XRE-family HTH domain